MPVFSNRPDPLTPATGHAGPPISCAISLVFGSLLLADRQPARRPRAVLLLAGWRSNGHEKPRVKRGGRESTGEDAIPPRRANLLRSCVSHSRQRRLPRPVERAAMGNARAGRACD